ncbi:MAG TPA: 4Fe-4S binding protein [Phototrophicaceae bacterium]|nr:4Fe-4S binding protein [Phototrophicaceae bacterium]
MRIGAMLVDTLRSFFQKPITQMYPFERTDTPERLRGKLHWNPENCTGCCLCVKDCPSEAIELITIDKKAKQFVMRYHPDRCTYCAQCVENCRFSCIEMSSTEWEMASGGKEFTINYGSEADIEHLLVKLAESGPDEA